MGFRWLIPDMAELDEIDLRKIAEAAIRVFRTVPWTVDGTEELMAMLRAFGCIVEGRKVTFTHAVVDHVLDRIAEVKERNLSSPEPIEAEVRVTYSTSGQALWCCDAQTDLVRPATRNDLADFCRVANTFPGMERTHPTFLPTDAPPRTRELHAYVEIMLNSDRPYHVSAYSPEVVDYMIEANTIYYGSREAGVANLLPPTTVWANSPFTISAEVIRTAMRARELAGIPLTFGAMPVKGVATPVTLDGALTLMTAEVLGLNTISLATEGTCAGWCTTPVGFDMGNAIHTQWGPEVILLAAAGWQVASHLFGVSSRGRDLVVNTTAAKVPGAQSMAEKSFAFGLNFACGCRHFGSLGTLAFADVGSIVELILDMEMVSSLAMAAEGFDVAEETIAEDLICRTVPRGASFLDMDHTARHCHSSQWLPALMDRRVPGAWINDPVEMLDRARRRAIQLADTAPNRCPHDEGRKAELRKLLKAADQEISY